MRAKQAAKGEEGVGGHAGGHRRTLPVPLSPRMSTEVASAEALPSRLPVLSELGIVLCVGAWPVARGPPSSPFPSGCPVVIA